MLMKTQIIFSRGGKSSREVLLKVKNVTNDFFRGISAKPFTAIPGPVKIPILGTLLPYKTGVKKLPAYHHEVHKLHQKYGSVVREVFGTQTIVHLFDPADIKHVYESDGKIPHIPPLQETSQLYRQKNDIAPGLGNVNGEEWYKLRRAVQHIMLRPKEVSHYYPLQDEVARRAMDKLEKEMDDEGCVQNLQILIAKWILESGGMCCFEKSLGCLNGGEDERLAQRIVEANEEIFRLSAEMKFSLRLYHYFRFSKYKKLNEHENYFYGVCLKFISETLEEIKTLMAENKLDEKRYNFLRYLMSREELSHKDIMSIGLALLTDGLSTTAPTFLGNLHCLALNPEVQETLFQEIKARVSPNDPITVDIINEMHYLKAFVKEVFRFYPVAEAVQRYPQKDMILGGYHIPAGTYIDLNPYVWLRSDKYFEEPEKLRPERWLRDTGGTPSTNPYILNPFSIGTRMCAGRRFAEQDIYAGLCRLLLKFRVEATSMESPQQEWSILLKPKTPLPVRFIKRV